MLLVKENIKKNVYLVRSFFFLLSFHCQPPLSFHCQGELGGVEGRFSSRNVKIPSGERAAIAEEMVVVVFLSFIFSASSFLSSTHHTSFLSPSLEGYRFPGVRSFGSNRGEGRPSQDSDRAQKADFSEYEGCIHSSSWRCYGLHWSNHYLPGDLANRCELEVLLGPDCQVRLRKV